MAIEAMAVAIRASRRIGCEVQPVRARAKRAEVICLAFIVGPVKHAVTGPVNSALRKD